MLEIRHLESHVPRFQERVDTGRPGDDSRSGCRGFLGLVPQPLCMKSKVCSIEEQTGGQILPREDGVRQEGLQTSVSSVPSVVRIFWFSPQRTQSSQRKKPYRLYWFLFFSSCRSNPN